MRLFRRFIRRRFCNGFECGNATFNRTQQPRVRQDVTRPCGSFPVCRDADMVPYRGLNCIPLQDDELKGRRTKKVSQIGSHNSALLMSIASLWPC